MVDPAEVAAALEGGADIVDVKDPREGALGAATPGVLRAIRARVAAPAELSAALGDAPHLPGTLALAAYGAALCGAEYVKVGLLGSNQPDTAREMLVAVRCAALAANPAVRVVAVGYADAARVGALPIERLPAVAHDAGIHGVLVDTLVKDGTSSFRAAGEDAIAGFVDSARAAGLEVGLAGSLRFADLDLARRLGPDLVGVRGAACDGGRGGTVRAERVRRIREALGLTPPASPSSPHLPAAPAAAPDGAR